MRVMLFYQHVTTFYENFYYFYVTHITGRWQKLWNQVLQVNLFVALLVRILEFILLIIMAESRKIITHIEEKWTMEQVIEDALPSEIDSSLRHRLSVSWFC